MLLTFPSTSVLFLFGRLLEGTAALTVCRIGGGGLFALGTACWIARNDTQSRSAMGLVVAMLVYDVTPALLLANAGIAYSLQGLILWPRVILHTAMTAWCVICLRCNWPATGGAG